MVLNRDDRLQALQWSAGKNARNATREGLWASHHCHRTCHHPLSSSPIKGEVPGRRVRHDHAPNAMQHLPLYGGLFTTDYLCPFVPIHGVIPAKAGIQAPVREIPAFAGMTPWFW